MDQNKKKTMPKAVALQYVPEQGAPRVVASGQGYVADKILETAAKGGVSVHKDEKLVEELTKIDLGAHIPPELYEIVARVLVFIEKLDKLEGYANHGE